MISCSNKEPNILINNDKENNTNNLIHYITQINTFYNNSKNIKNNSKHPICIILQNNQYIKNKNKNQYQSKLKISLLKVNIKYNKCKTIVNLNLNN